MKAILEFDMCDDREAFELALNASEYKCKVEEFENWLRAQIKHTEMSAETFSAYEHIREKFYQFMNDSE